MEPGATEREVPLQRKRMLSAAVVIAATLTLLAPASARAGDCLIGQLLCKESPTPTPSPTPSRSTSSKPKPKPSSSATAKPKGPAPAPYTGLRSAISFVLDTAGTARNTQRLLDLLGLVKPAGATLTQAELARGFGRFPVLGYVWYQNDYGAPRYEPYFHLHEGVDLFAVSGTPASACVDGVIRKLADGSIGGISIWLDGDDGITYYYGHLTGYAPGVVAGKRVRMGEVLGYVGDTGVAQGTYPHLHFEVHPRGGLPVSPKPILDAWLNNAEASAIDAYQRLVEYNSLNRIGAARWQKVFDLMREPAAPVPALWTVALDPTASSLGLDMAFAALAWGNDPSSSTLSSNFVDESASPLAVSSLSPMLLAPSGAGGFAAISPR
jgi:murein DD-endopeptidase MepM/ murein hydrolase activator NlpD